MNEWVAVIDRNPEKEGLYLVTIINRKTGEREIKTSYYDENGWKNDRTVAWKDVFNDEPYQGKTPFDGIIAQNRINKERKLERERKTFDLRLAGLSWSEISTELGVSYTTSSYDLHKYLRRREGCEGSCLQCKYASIMEGGGMHNLKCEKLNHESLYDSTGCRLFELVDKKRVLCKSCKHFCKDYPGSAWGYCLIQKKDKYEDAMCTSGEAKDE